MLIGKQLRSKIEDSTFLHNKDREIYITVSGGISIFKAGDNPSTVFEMADRGL